MVNPRDIYLDPNFSDQQVYGPPAPSGQAQPRSLLDMLRERSARELEGERMTRMRDFGAGMLASGSPNFFTNLAAGTRAQAEGERSRTDRLRQLAETERQQQELETRQAAQRAEEDYRRQSLGLREREVAAGRRPNIVQMIDPATGNAVLVNAETGQVVSRTEFRPMQLERASRQVDARTELNARAAAQRAVEAARTRAANVAQTLTPEKERQIYATTYEQNLNPQTTPGTSDVRQPPSQVLQYGDPATPTAPRTGPRISTQPQQQQPQ
jgi:hypothetical protein